MNDRPDFGTFEQQKRGIVIVHSSDGGKAARVMHQTRLDTIYNRGLLDEHQYHAGRHLQEDYRVAGYAFNIRSSADFSIKDGRGLKEEVALQARKRLVQAQQRLTKAERVILKWIVLEDGYMKDLKASEPQWMHLTYNILRDALDKVAKEYGL